MMYYEKIMCYEKISYTQDGLQILEHVYYLSLNRNIKC